MVPHADASASSQIPLDGTRPSDRVGAEGRYELVERIGSGGMGSVWRALDHKLGCERAVKVLDSRYSAIPAFVKRFRQEAIAASRVAHPNIVTVFDVAGEDERPVFLVMELLEGNTLSQLVKGSGRMPWAQVQRYIDQIAAGLGAAHAQGVVHRDIKPGNCIVLVDEQVKILDFGIANMPELGRLTAAGEIIGTCSYMAPEQIRGLVDKRSDMYALGVLTFRLLSGRVPFAHRDQDKVLLAHLTEPPPAPSSLVAGLPGGVDDFVLRMLAKQPHKRFDDMEELRRVLASIERGAVVAFDAPTAVPPSKSHTAMFEDAPTRAVVREPVPVDDAPRPEPSAELPTPGSQGEPVRVTLNTAPAGSGTLAQLEAEARRLPGTVLLGDEGALAPGGTLVVQGPPLPMPPGPDGARVGGVATSTSVGAGMPSQGAAARPNVATPSPRVGTVRSPAPRPLGGLAASTEGPPRVTRFTAPNEAVDGGMMRGVVAAFGGIALAAAVVVGWVLYTRTADTSVPAAAPAAALAPEGPEAMPADEGAAEPAPQPEAEAGAQPDVIEAGAQPEAIAAEGKTAPDGDAGAAVAGATTAPPTEARGAEAKPPGGEPLADDPQAADAKSKKRRKAKASETTEPQVATPEPEPEPQPVDPEAPKKKKGDLRDPF